MREKLMDIVCDSIATDRCVVYCSHPHCGLVHTVVQKLIANGVTIPVRCKDCKHQNEDGDCDIHDEWFTRTPDDFCSYGERRTDD